MLGKPAPQLNPSYGRVKRIDRAYKIQWLAGPADLLDHHFHPAETAAALQVGLVRRGKHADHVIADHQRDLAGVLALESLPHLFVGRLLPAEVDGRVVFAQHGWWLRRRADAVHDCPSLRLTRAAAPRSGRAARRATPGTARTGRPPLRPRPPSRRSN